MKKTLESTFLLAVNISNEETELGLFQGNTLLGTWSFVTRTPSTKDELTLAVASFLNTRDLPFPTASIICSVVPLLTHVWEETLYDLIDSRPLVVGPGLKSGLAMQYKDPAQVGADRVVCAVAARELFGAPVIVADFGVTTTLSVVTREGAFAGGAIAPGIGIAVSALSEHAAQLSEVSLALPKSAIGRTTAEAIRSGIILGETVRVDGLVKAMEKELGYKTNLVSCGCYAKLACAASSLDFSFCADLALQGLRFIWEHNQR